MTSSESSPMSFQEPPSYTMDQSPIASTSKITSEEIQFQVELEKVLLDLQVEEDSLRNQLSLVLQSNSIPNGKGKEVEEPVLKGLEKELAILEQEYCNLSASLDALQTHTPITPSQLPSSTTLLNLSQTSSLTKVVTELNIALEWETIRGKKELKNLERDKILLKDCFNLNEGLKERKEGNELERKLSGREIILQARLEANDIESRFKILTRALIKFIDLKLNAEEENEEHEKEVEEIQGNGGENGHEIEKLDIKRYFKKARLSNLKPHLHNGKIDNFDVREDNGTDLDIDGSGGGEHKHNSNPGLILKKFLEDLMNHAINNPESPYITLPTSSSSTNRNEEEEIPQEIINFLLKAGILLEHPTSSKKVRLVEFSAGI